MTTTTIHHNVRVLAEALRAVGAVSATAEYSGADDAGDYFDVSIAWDGAQGFHPGPVTYLAYLYRGYEAPVEVVERTTEFHTALEDICWDAVSEAGHEGWENNDGGGGKFTVFATGTAVLEHYRNYVEVAYDEHTFGDEAAGEGADATASEVHP